MAFDVQTWLLEFKVWASSTRAVNFGHDSLDWRLREPSFSRMTVLKVLDDFRKTSHSRESHKDVGRI